MENIKNILETLFSPLSKDYCSLFYYLTIGSFIAIILSIIMLLTRAFKNKGKTLVFDLITVLPLYVILYFKNRLLYTMCIH